MFRVPDETVRRYDAAMDAARIGMQERGYSYQKWLRCYLDICDTYRLSSVESGSLTPIPEKLEAKKQSDVQCPQASRARRLFTQTYVLTALR